MLMRNWYERHIGFSSCAGWDNRSYLLKGFCWTIFFCVPTSSFPHAPSLERDTCGFVPLHIILYNSYHTFACLNLPAYLHPWCLIYLPPISRSSLVSLLPIFHFYSSLSLWSLLSVCRRSVVCLQTEIRRLDGYGNQNDNVWIWCVRAVSLMPNARALTHAHTFTHIQNNKKQKKTCTVNPPTQQATSSVNDWRLSAVHVCIRVFVSVCHVMPRGWLHLLCDTVDYWQLAVWECARVCASVRKSELWICECVSVFAAGWQFSLHRLLSKICQRCHIRNLFKD